MDIASSLLFQNERISNIYSISLYGVFFAIAVSLIIFISLKILSRRVILSKWVAWRGIPMPIIPHISDENFETKIAVSLRYAITHIVLPRHAYAHTAREVRSYLWDHPMVIALMETENAEYSGDPLSLEKRREIVSVLEEYIAKK